MNSTVKKKSKKTKTIQRNFTTECQQNTKSLKM